jgi:hypothetical protein
MTDQATVSGPTSNQLLHGRDQAPPEVHVLHAGPVDALLEGPDLRRIRLGDVELVQRVYVAVRDEVWNTIPGTYAGWQIDADDDHFTVHFTGTHRYAEIDYAWNGSITGAEDGTITYEMAGEARRPFRHAKIGLNLHHALTESVGQPYRAWTPAGEITGTLPTLIEPQLLDNGRLTALFPEYERLQIALPGGGTVDFQFEGDWFEMQDHRNWTDANLKTYGTPLSVPWPMDAAQGQQFWQRVTIRAEGVGAGAGAVDEAPRVVLGGVRGRLPRLGLGVPSDRLGISTQERERLLALHPDHLRVDLYLDDDDWRAQLGEGRTACESLGTSMELAVFVPPERLDLLDELAAAVPGTPLPVARVLIFAGGRGFGVGGGSTPGDVARGAPPPRRRTPAGSCRRWHEPVLRRAESRPSRDRAHGRRGVLGQPAGPRRRRPLAHGERAGPGRHGGHAALVRTGTRPPRQPGDPDRQGRPVSRWSPGRGRAARQCGSAADVLVRRSLDGGQPSPARRERRRVGHVVRGGGLARASRARRRRGASGLSLRALDGLSRL